MLKIQEGGFSDGSIPHRKNKELYGDGEPPSTQHGAFAESKGASLPHALPARKLGLHHKGACPDMQGWRGQHLRYDKGTGRTRVHHP